MRLRYFSSAFAFLYFPFQLQAQMFDGTPARIKAEVRVINALTKQPVPDALVKIGVCGPGEGVYGKTDAQGRWERTSQGAVGCTQLDVYRPGFVRAGTRNGMMDSSVVISGGGQMAAPGFRVTRTAAEDGTATVKVEVSLLPVAVVSGVVTSPFGAPMAGCQVQFLEATGAGMREQSPVMAVTDDRGEFRTARLMPGQYYLRMRDCMHGGAWDRTFRLTYFPGVVGTAKAKPLVVAAGEEIRASFQVQRMAGVKVSGRVVTPPGAPEGRSVVRVVLVPRDGASPQLDATATTGEYEVADVLPGKYTLFAGALSMQGGGPGRVTLGAARELEVGDSGVSGVDVDLVPIADLRGTVKFDEGCQPRPVRLMVSGRTYFTLGMREVVSGADGSFTFTGMGPGQFTVMPMPVEPTGTRLWLSGMVLGGKTAPAEGFVFPAAEGEATLEIRLSCAGSGRW